MDDNKWRWIQYDMETGFGVATNLGPQYEMLGPQFNMIQQIMEEIPIPDFGTYGPQRIFPKLIMNNEFKNEFLNWFSLHLNSDYLPDSLLLKFNNMATELEPYMPEYEDRWPFQHDMNINWYISLDSIREFLGVRGGFVRQHLFDEFGWTDSKEIPIKRILPETYKLYQNFPNPVRQYTTFGFQLLEPGTIKITIKDVTGKTIDVISKNYQYGGNYSLVWHNNGIEPGLYYYTLVASSYIEAKKMIIIK